MINKILNYYKKHGLKLTFFWLCDCFVFKFRMRKIKSVDFKKIKTDAAEKPFLTKKDAPTVFVVASIPYYDIGGGQRCSQIAKTFNIMGYNVEYYYAFKSSESVRFNMPVPVSAHLLINDDACSKIQAEATSEDLFIFEAPCAKFSKILDIAIAKNAKICYESIDNWETFLGNSIYDENMLKHFLQHAHVLVGTARPLVKQLEEYLVKYKIPPKKILYLANAVDDELFCQNRYAEKPADLKLGKTTLLYYGSLWGEWFDWDLLVELAGKHPEYAINLIGEDSNLTSIKRTVPQNIHFLGLKRQSDLPAYLKYTDYAVIPFKPGEISDYVSPLKVFEYISMHTRVLSTVLPDIKDYPNVFCANTAKEWESVIEKGAPVDKAAADAFVLDNNWKARVSRLIDAVYPEKNNSALKDKLSVVVLNYNNKNVIFKCINTLLKFNELYNCEIIVVDNGSADGSCELLEKTYKNGEITLIKNSKNGCSSGRNLGVSYSQREYILFLDSDQWVNNKYWLQPYEQIMQKNANVGLIGWAAGFFNKKHYAYHVVDTFPYRFMPSDMLCRCDIGYLGSGGMIISRSDFNAIGGFDVYYDPTCYEDTDISMKIRDFGKEIYYCPYLGVCHLPHQTTKSGSQEHEVMIKAKGDYFISKWTTKNKALFKHIK